VGEIRPRFHAWARAWIRVGYGRFPGSSAAGYVYRVGTQEIGPAILPRLTDRRCQRAPRRAGILGLLLTCAHVAGLAGHVLAAYPRPFASTRAIKHYNGIDARRCHRTLN
jgi:hypothetical protein